MTQIQDIVAQSDLTTTSGMDAAAEKMKSVPDHEIHLYLIMRDTLQTTSPATRSAMALALFESGRRERNEARRLAFMTTFFSGVVALLGVGLGALLTQS